MIPRSPLNVFNAKEDGASESGGCELSDIEDAFVSNEEAELQDKKRIMFYAQQKNKLTFTTPLI